MTTSTILVQDAEDFLFHSHRSDIKVLEGEALVVLCKNVIGDVKIDFRTRHVRKRTTLHHASNHLGHSNGGIEETRMEVNGIETHLNQLFPSSHNTTTYFTVLINLGTREVDGLTIVGFRLIAQLENDLGNIVVSHRLLESLTSIDGQEVGILSGNDRNPVQETVFHTKHIRRTDNDGIRELLTKDLLAHVLGSSPLRVVLGVGLKSTDVNQVLDAHLLADLGKTLRPEDVDVLIGVVDPAGQQELGLIVLADAVDDDVAVADGISNGLLVLRVVGNTVDLSNVAEGLQTEGLVDVSSAGDVADGASLS